jgi:hypothetical protein
VTSQRRRGPAPPRRSVAPVTAFGVEAFNIDDRQMQLLGG